MSGSLGYGQNKQDATSQSTSSSFGQSAAVSGDTSRSESYGISGGQSNQTLAFQDIFDQLYGKAAGAAGNVAMGAPQLQAAAQQLFSGGSNFLQSLSGNAGTDYATNRLNSTSAVDDIIASMKQDSADLFNNQLNPAITSRSVVGGTLGGGRQGVAQGIAQAQVANDFAKNSAALRYGDVQAKDQLALGIANNSVAAAGTGLGALPGMLDIFERGQNAELAPYSSLSQILGGPTTLTSSSQFAQNTAQSMADAFSRSFGEQSSESQSTSRAKGRQWNFNTAFSYGGSAGDGA